MTRDVNAHGELMPTRPLTPAQLEALNYRAHGMTVDEVASALHVGSQAIKNRCWLALRRLGVEGLVDAFLVLGWLRPPAADEVLIAHSLRRRTLPWWDVP